MKPFMADLLETIDPLVSCLLENPEPFCKFGYGAIIQLADEDVVFVHSR